METDISETEFCALLSSLKLLKQDVPQLDARWTQFYRRFFVHDKTAVKKREQFKYVVVPTLLAMISLADGSTETKALAVAEVLSG